MDPYDKLPRPDSPKVQVALEVCLALEVVLKINYTFKKSGHRTEKEVWKEGGESDRESTGEESQTHMP